MCWNTIVEKAKSNGRSGTTVRNPGRYFDRQSALRPVKYGLGRQPNHFAAHVDCVYFAEHRASARVTRPAPHPISRTRISAGTLPWQILVMSVRISSATVLCPDSKNSWSVQASARRIHVVAGVFPGAPVPVLTHLLNLLVGADLVHAACADFLFSHRSLAVRTAIIRYEYWDFLPSQKRSERAFPIDV